MNILGIDTSCDDASVAVAQDDRLLSNITSSQIAYHAFWGGVVPSIAKRKHRETIDGVIALALKRAGLTIQEIDVIAVTVGPGLAVALEVGVEKAKELAQQYGKQVIAVNHMEGHLYASFARNRNGKYLSGLDADFQKDSDVFPLLALLISGGHTEMILMREHLQYTVVGRTKDDAIGEAYDKVARMLNLGYPGGPIVEQLAKQGNPESYTLPISMLDGGLDFSYSGLKTAVLRQVQLLGRLGPSLREQFGDRAIPSTEYDGYMPLLSTKPTYILDKQQICDLAAAFEHAAVAQLEYKVRKALEKYSEVKKLVLGGGVVGNQYLKKRLRAVCKRFGVQLVYPKSTKLTMDNAGMIAIAGYFHAKNQEFVESSTLDRNPSWELGMPIAMSEYQVSK